MSREIGICANCGREMFISAKGLCGSCYGYERRTGRARPPEGRPKRGKCTIEGCGQPHYAHGWCGPHYFRWRQAGDPLAPDRRISFDPFSEELWDCMDRSGGDDSCWTWLKSLSSKGYGNIHRNGRTYGAHRLAYELANGPIPDGLFVLHHCDNPPCCNPAHLWVGTNADNMADMARKGRGRTHQEHGENHHRAKLTRAQVDEIRSRYPAESQTQLAREFGVYPSTVSRIISGIRWARD